MMDLLKEILLKYYVRQSCSIKKRSKRYINGVTRRHAEILGIHVDIIR